VTNLSWGHSLEGALQARDRLFDFHSRYNLGTFVAAAGNDGQWVHSPATAWNVIAVGNIDDKGTSDWSDDEMYENPVSSSDGSSFRNPRTRCEKPNVAARGTNIASLGVRETGWLNDPRITTGTSNATPFVTAGIALAMNRNPTLLPSPEAAMATIMASAWNNVEGAPAISSVDGAGGIHTSAASRLAADFRVVFLHLSAATFEDNRYFLRSIRLREGEATRIAIAWSASPSRTYPTSSIQSDLDLVVFEGRDSTSGAVAGVSWSFGSNFELVQFVPERTGWYTIAIHGSRIGSTTERVAVAYSQRDLDGGR